MNHRSFPNPILLVCLLVTVMLSGLFFLNRDDASAELTIPTSLETNGDPDASGYTLNSQGDLAYVVLLDSNLVALVDTASHEVVGTINAGASGCVGPERAKITPDGSQAYFPCNYSDSVLVVETTGNTVITNVTGIPSPNDATFTRDGAYALIGTVNGGIVVIDTMTYEIVDTISNPARIGSLATHPWLDVIYATSFDGHVLVVDTTSFTVVDSIPFGGEVWDVVVSPDGKWVFASDRYGAGVAVIDAETNTLETTVTELGEMCGLEISPDGSLVFAFGLGSGIHVIDGTSFSLLTTIGGIGYAYEGETTLDGSQLFVGNWSDEVFVIDTQTFSVNDQITLPGSNSRGVAIRPQYVTAGVYLSPPTQTNQGAPGQVVTHEFTVLNLTGSSDSFDLELGSHAWDATLSTDQVGPLENGESASFTVDVTVPVSADWYTTDSVVVTATSTNNPTDYTDTAQITTEAYAPPQISVSPESLSSTQEVGEVTTQTLTISNGFGVPLTYDISEGAYPGNVLMMHLDDPAGSTVFMDDSGNGNHGSCSSESCPTAGVAGRFGTALSFDGSNDYVEVGSPVPPALQIQSEISLEAWIYATGYPAYDTLGTIVGCQYDQTNSGYAIHLDGRTDSDGQPSPQGHIHFQIGDGEWHTTNANAQVPLNQWIHIVAVRKANEDARIYYNGVQQPSTSVPWDGSITYTGAELDLGRQSDYPDRFFSGVIDEVAIYDRALSEQEIQALYLVGPGGIDVPWLSIDPVSGTIPTSGEQDVSVTFDAIGLQPDTYTATLAILSNDPVTPSVSIPVTMTVQPTASMGWVEGVVTDAWTDNPLEADITAQGQPYTVTSDPATGAYKLWLEAGSYTIQAAATGYVTATAEIEITAQAGTSQDFALVEDVPVIEVSPEELTATLLAGESQVQPLTITNAGPASLEFEVTAGGGPGTSFFAASTVLYGYDVAEAWLMVIGTEDNTHVQVIDLDTGAIIDENSDLDHYQTWNAYPNDGTYYKVEADKPVIGFESNQYASTAFIPSLDSGSVGKEFIFYYYQELFPLFYYIFAVEDTSVEVYDTSESLVASQTMLAGEYWELSLPTAVYHVVSTGRIIMEQVGVDGYSTVSSTDGDGVGDRFYFGTYSDPWIGAFAVFAYRDADVDVYDLDSGMLLYSQHINQGDYWWQADVGMRRLRLESSGLVEVWAGDAEGGDQIEYLGDDISFAGGDGSREFYLHSLMEGSVIFAPFNNTVVDVDGTVYHLNKDEYLHLGGCCYFRHIQSNQPILIQTLGRDGEWNNMGTYLGGVVANVGSVPWLTINPTSGTVTAYSSLPVQVTLDATGLQPGTYTANISIQSNDPVTPSVSVPVTMTVQPTDTMGWVEGFVSDSGTGDPLEASITALGQPYTVTSDPTTGYYKLWLETGSYEIQASAAGYVTENVSVAIIARRGLRQDFNLIADVPVIKVSPESLSATLLYGESVTQAMTITNDGPVPLTFNIAGIDLSSLVLWNKLGSDAEITHSEIGENGTIVGTSYAYEPGQFGDGYVRKDIGQNYVAFPASILDPLTERGTIELWINPKVPQPVPFEYGDWGLIGNPYGHYGVPEDFNIGVIWLDAVAGGPGFAGIVGFDENGVGTPGEPTQFVATPYEPFHVAISWDIEGIDGSADTVRVYRDGEVVSSTTAAWNPNGTDRYDIILGYIPDGNGFDKHVADNIKIWDYAKTDFSDRFIESPFELSAPWLTVEPESGTINGNSSQEISVTFDATGLQPGTYTATITIQSNDPVTPLVTVPVTLTVTPSSPSLSLLPELQQGYGKRGETLTFTYTLTNLGDSKDEFSLQVAALWKSTLSASTTGLLDPGESFIFTLQVTIPPGARIGDTDTAVITATSMHDPLTTATARASSFYGFKLILPQVFK